MKRIWKQGGTGPATSTNLNETGTAGVVSDVAEIPNFMRFQTPPGPVADHESNVGV